MKSISVLTLLAAMVMAGTHASAQEFPSRTVRMIVPYPAGGANDVVARALADRLNKKWGQPVIIENRPGGGTTIGTRAVIDAAPDGHTVLFTSSSALSVTPHTINVPFDALTDLAPVALIVSVPAAMAISNDTPAKTVSELIDLAKKNPGKLTYASAGRGTYTHIALEYFTKLAGIDMLHVPYSGTSPAITDMLGGRINMYFVAISVFQDLERSGKLKIAAVGTEARHPDRPDLPTIGESVPGFGIDVWFGVAAPARTPPAILDKLNADMNEILKDPNFQNSLVKPQGFTLKIMNRQDFARYLKADYERWGKMVEAVGLQKPKQ